MTIEQKPELNRYVDPSIPLTWAYRQRMFKLTLPIWFFIWVCFLEMGILKAWFTDRLTLDLVMTLFGICLFMVVFVFGMAEIQIRIEQRSKRVLKIKDTTIVVSPAKHQSIWWKHISKFQFEPILENSGLTVFKVFGFHKFCFRWNGGFPTEGNEDDEQSAMQSTP